MAKFKKHVRYDKDMANDGVWFSIIDEVENNYGEFRLRHVDRANPRTKLDFKRIQTKYQESIRSGKMTTDESQRIYFCEAVLVDWKGVLDEKGKEVPFTVADAIEYFSDDDNLYVLERLIQLSDDIRNFNKLEPVEDIIKNS